MARACAAVLFDLDGTLIDSAPDLAAAANAMRAARDLAELPYPMLRRHAGSGARGMLAAALECTPGDADYETLRDECLRRYEATMPGCSRVFDPVLPLLDRLDAARLRWGIVTNKAGRLAVPQATALGLMPRAAVVVAGDCTPHLKPHPASLIEAARRLGVDPTRCVYVGDDLRDVQAARAAGMPVVAAAWGYLGSGPAIADWGADAVLQTPADLLTFLGMA